VATLTPADEAYIEALHGAWDAVGIGARVDMGPAFYRRGQDFYKRRDYPAAVSDFDRAIGLGVAEASDRREIALQVMAEVQQREVEAEKVRQAEMARQAAERQRQAEMLLKLTPLVWNSSLYVSAKKTDSVRLSVKISLLCWEEETVDRGVVAAKVNT
jgi:hypothetical protein